MTESKSIEIICPACGNETILKRTPRYEGFKRTGDDLNCASCGHPFADETEVPFKAREKPAIFDQSDLDARPEVFKKGEATRLCRFCANYVVNPFIQRCAILRKEVEATDSCRHFKKPAEPPKPK
jgi:ribosomal protein S27E